MQGRPPRRGQHPRVSGNGDRRIEGSEAYSPPEKAAIAFAEKLALDHHTIENADILALRQHFDDGQILELMMMAGQYIGFGRMLAVLQLETPACPLPARDRLGR